jgi:hypothetical protein
MSSNEDASYSSDSDTHFVSQDDDSDTLWKVIEIVGENRKAYKVRWEGIDPKTKKPWAPSWVAKHDCTDDLVYDWKQSKARKRKEAATKKGVLYNLVSLGPWF